MTPTDEAQYISVGGEVQKGFDPQNPVAYHTHDGTNSPGVDIDRALQCVVVGFTRTVIVGDGKFYIHIDKLLDGKHLVYAHARVITAGTTGTTDIQIANTTKGVDMLATKVTIDSGETGSDTGAAFVVDRDKNGVTLNDVLRIDIDAVSTTAPKGLIVTLGFK